jgi:hypothetical protein
MVNRRATGSMPERKDVTRQIELAKKQQKEEDEKKNPTSRFYTLTEEQFLKDVSQHEMKVLLDNGIYRHLRFANSDQQHSWNQWFEIVTFPGYLVYVGDMGSFVFSRLQDMFEFFRTEHDDLRINPSYWGEKLEAVDRDGRSHLVFDAEAMKEQVKEALKVWLDDEDLSEEDREELKEEVQSEVLDRIEDENEYDSRRAVSEFSYMVGKYKYVSTQDLLTDLPAKKHRYEFSDSWEWNCQKYTNRFIWCCYAIAWVIKKYDESQPIKSTPPSKE